MSPHDSKLLVQNDLGASTRTAMTALLDLLHDFISLHCQVSGVCGWSAGCGRLQEELHLIVHQPRLICLQKQQVGQAP